MKTGDTSAFCFHRDARAYITRLINLQRHVPGKYKRIDRAAVSKSIDKLETLLAFYPYNNDLKMARFWRTYRYHIRILLPTNKHPAFSGLLIEFEHFDSIANYEDENAIWNHVASALNKF